MRKIKEILRLKWECGLSKQKIAQSCGVERSTAADYLLRAAAAGLSWPLPEGLTEAELEPRLFPGNPKRSSRKRPLPDWSAVHKELRKKGVTLALLWTEYMLEHPGGYQYTQLCNYYRTWKKDLDLCMRQEHTAGEKLFVDYCGLTVPVVDRDTGETKEAQIFMAALGASNYTYAEAIWTQRLPDWIGAHARALNFLEGCPEVVIPDNLRSGGPFTARLIECVGNHKRVRPLLGSLPKPRGGDAHVVVFVRISRVIIVIPMRTVFIPNRQQIPIGIFNDGRSVHMAVGLLFLIENHFRFHIGSDRGVSGKRQR